MNSLGRENDSERERLSLPARLFIQLIKAISCLFRRAAVRAVVIRRAALSMQSML